MMMMTIDWLIDDAGDDDDDDKYIYIYTRTKPI